ncbi:hypothetical protein MSIBF_A3180009 [groundwater metagenome]|uniref:Uncharacterized protein n=1 Tax=groundwater metagenome TaxID=717931 RepID=A0A098EC37_9ZZZZ
MTVLASILNLQHSTDIISLVIIVGAFISGIILLLYMYRRYNKGIMLRNFATEFLNLEKEKREKLLKKYLKRDDKCMRVAGGVFLNHYYIISNDLRENLLKNVLKKNIKMIEDPIDKLTPVFGNLALNILEKHFDIIPQHLRNEIITQSLSNQGGMGKEMLAEILAKNFEKFAHDVRNKILLKLVSLPNDNMKFQIAKILAKHFNDIPHEILNEALQQLMESKNKMNIEYAMDILFRNFYKIDIFTRDELLTRYVGYTGANKTVLDKFLSAYGKSIINQELKKRIMELAK